MQNVLYGKGIAFIANILSTSNQAAATMPTKAGASVIATRSHLARKHLAIIAIIAITGFTIACPNNNSSPWTLRDSGTTNGLQGVTYGGPSGRELFVAVGNCPTDSSRNCIVNGPIITSPDGITWTERDSGVRIDLRGVTYGGPSGSELFVATGHFGTILISPDGINWTPRTSMTTDSLSDITYGNSTFVAVGAAASIITSPDGMTWTLRDSGTVNGLQGVTYGEASRRELFVAVGECPKDSNRNCNDDGVIVTSPDGITWTARDSGLQSNFYGIASRTDGLSTIFAAVGGCIDISNVNAICSNSNPIVTSNNGIGWATKENPSAELLSGVAATADGFLAVGLCPLDSKNERCIGNATIVTSSDGVAWTAEDSGVQTVLSGAAYGNGISVIVGARSNCADLDADGNCTGNSVILTK